MVPWSRQLKSLGSRTWLIHQLRSVCLPATRPPHAPTPDTRRRPSQSRWSSRVRSTVSECCRLRPHPDWPPWTAWPSRAGWHAVRPSEPRARHTTTSGRRRSPASRRRRAGPAVDSRTSETTGHVTGNVTATAGALGVRRQTTGNVTCRLAAARGRRRMGS